MAAQTERRAHRDPPFLLPRELLDRRFACDCGAQSPVSWYQKQASSLHAVQGTTSAGGYWIRSSFENGCAACGKVQQVPVTRWTAKSRLTVTADEAFRELNNLRVFVVAGCAVQRDFLPILAKRCAVIEKKIVKVSDGAVNRFHAKEVMSIDVPLAKRAKIISDMASAISANRVNKFVVAFYSVTKTPEKVMRDAATSFFMLFVLWLAGRDKTVPSFEFDRTQAGKSNGWIAECFTRIKRFPIFSELAGGNFVADPIDVDPLTTIRSKSSDCIAYTVAREILKAAGGVRSEVSTKNLGMIQSAFFGEADVTYGCQTGFPSTELLQDLRAHQLAYTADRA